MFMAIAYSYVYVYGRCSCSWLMFMVAVGKCQMESRKSNNQLENNIRKYWFFDLEYRHSVRLNRTTVYPVAMNINHEYQL